MNVNTGRQGHTDAPCGPVHTESSRTIATVVVVGIVVAGVFGWLFWWLTEPERGQNEPVGGVQLPAAAVRPVAVGSAPPPIGPTGARLLIPSIGVNAPITPETTTGSGSSLALTIPADIQEVAWFMGTAPNSGVLPGAPGDALLAGHVDSAAAGPGALYRLASVTPGVTITVVGSDGLATNWQVSSPPVLLSKTTVAEMSWATTGPPTISIVTCGGPFDASTGHYVDNVLVHATEKAGGGNA